nr:hypothetical protein [bacterium]
GYIKAQGYNFEAATDTGGAAELYGVRGIPMTLFISREGKIVDKVVGGMDKMTFEEKLGKIL